LEDNVPGMRFLRTFLIVLSALSLGLSGTACGSDGADDPEASTTTGVTPDDVQEPGDGEGGSEDEEVPADPTTPPTNPGGVNY
jgi:hypothetical protein